MPVSAMPAPFKRPLLFRICELATWPKTMASTPAGKRKNKNPLTRLARAKPLVLAAPGCCIAGCCAAACGGTYAVAGKLAPHLLQDAAASSFAFAQAGQAFIASPDYFIRGIPPSYQRRTSKGHRDCLNLANGAPALLEHSREGRVCQTAAVRRE